MHHPYLTSLLIVVSASLACFAQVAQTDTQIHSRLQKFVDEKKRAPGIVVGLIDENGKRVIAYGNCQNGQTNAVDGDTLFEIGSITKVFTTLLLQDMVDRSELKLDDPISKFLPPSVKAPTRNGKEITLLDLATHRSGLPRLPDNFGMLHMVLHAGNPYADYTTKQLYEFISNYELTRDIGAEYEYSNVGVGLLGQLLALRANTNYEALVVNRVCEPLNMHSTRITLSPELKARLATGHSDGGKPVSNWDVPALAGCGAMRSSVNDMLKFLALNMGTDKGPLSEAAARTHTPRADAFGGQKIGLAWHINTAGVTWHNGGTGGYRSFIGWNTNASRGIVVLGNSANDVDNLALAILSPKKTHKTATIDYAVYDRYVGNYKFPGAKLTVSRDGDRFFARLSGQQKIEFFPETETDFFCKAVDAQLTFVKDKAGAVMAVILHQNGFDQRAERMN